MKIQFDHAQFNAALDALESFGGKKARTKFKNAFNRAGFDTRKRMIEHIGQTFKDPNSYTRNSPYFTQLKFNDDNAIGGVIEFGHKKAGKGVGAGIYLMPQEWGGSRAFKGFEIRLRRMGFLPDGRFAVPTRDMPKPSRNPSSLERLANDLGKAVTRIVNGKKNRGAKYEKYFVIREKRGPLHPGVYERKSSRRIVRLFAFVDSVSYKQLFGFYQKANKDFSELFVAKVADELARG